MASVCGQAQIAMVHSAPLAVLPAVSDSNSPAHWQNGELRVFNSAGFPKVSSGADQFHLGDPQSVEFDVEDHLPLWIESTWTDAAGALYAWYHNEPQGLCDGKLTVPRIGALVSYDGGAKFYDLGIVLESGDPPDCSAANGFFAGGHGDFSVIADRDGEYFYFLFGNYGGPAETQGIAVARMAVSDRLSPAGRVWKYADGDWLEPGLGGRVSPIFPAATNWQRPDTDAYWGPSIHWNTSLQSYVVLMNRTCCRPMWPQEGIYVTFNAELEHPDRWTRPQRILERPPDYYPQVLGVEADGTDTLAGQSARLYIHGRSEWAIRFVRGIADPDAEGPDPPPARMSQ